jgi:hypothetical protein
MTPRGPVRLDRVRRGLTDRDVAVLEDLTRVRLLTGEMVRRLHVWNGSDLTRARRARGVLQRLHDVGLVHRLGRQVGGVRAGSSGFVYVLSPRGRRLLHAHGLAEGAKQRKAWETSERFVDHLLAVSEVYVRLREAERDGRGELLRFDAEPACWRYWSDLTGAPQVLKPDAFVVTGNDEFEFETFLEVDCGTETRPVLRRKAETYVAYWSSGEEQRRGVFPKVLWQAPSDARAERITEVLGGLDPSHWRLFQVVTPNATTTSLTGRNASPDNYLMNEGR